MRTWLCTILSLCLAACTPGVRVDLSPPSAAPEPLPPPVSSAPVDLSGPFEPSPRLPSGELLPGLALVGAGYQIAAEAQVVDYYGQFELRSDVGNLVADGADVLRLRVRELAAVRKLEALERSEVFKDAAARGVRKPVDAMTQVGSEPAATASGLPAGVGRFLVRTALEIKELALDINDYAIDAMADDADAQGDDGPSTGSKAQKAATSLTLRYIGYNKARREIARHVGADPYSTNPLIDRRLDSLAWAAWSGNKLTSLGWGLIGGVAGSAIGYAKDAYELVWELPPEDLKRRNLKVLAELGIGGKPARDLVRRSKAFTLTQQTEFVELLRLPEFHHARRQLFALALKAERESHARYLNNALRILHYAHDAEPGALTAVVLGGSPALKRADGSAIVALPVDYLSWTREIAEFAWREDLIGQRNVLLVTGALSPTALDAFSAAGWSVRERVSLAPADWVEPEDRPDAAQTAPLRE